MFQNLSDKLANAFSKFRNKGKLTEADVREGMREVKLALLEADVNFKVVREFIKKVTERAVGAEVLESLVPSQQIIKIVNEELVELMGKSQAKLEISSKPPTIVMMVGLQGSGKTTHSGKLAGMYKKQGKNPLLVACDIYRPAAIKQLEVVGETLGIPVFQMGTESPVKIASEAVKYADKNGYDMVFLDTAGRLHNKATLMKELAKLRKIIDREAPNAAKETLLVLDATTGQNGLIQARQFKETAGLTGIILTKLDGTAKGGIVIAIAQELQVPVKFVGLGEGIDDLRPFDAREFVNDLI